MVEAEVHERMFVFLRIYVGWTGLSFDPAKDLKAQSIAGLTDSLPRFTPASDLCLRYVDELPELKFLEVWTELENYLNSSATAMTQLHDVVHVSVSGLAQFCIAFCFSIKVYKMQMTIHNTISKLSENAA